MSLMFKSKKLTLGNYLEVLSGYSTDIQDEVRSAILDDTSIGSYIAKFADDSYSLNQVRLAIREYVPPKYVSQYLKGSTTYLIRKLFREGYDLGVLDPYLPLRGLERISTNSLNLVVSAVYRGADISRVDFCTVPEETVPLVCEGLLKGYPMWLCTNLDITLSNKMITMLMKGMLLELDIHPFLTGDWSVEQVNLIIMNARKLDYTVLLKHINCKFSVEHLREVIYVASLYLDFLPMCLKDDDGSPIFNSYQLDVIRRVIEDGLAVDDFLKPSLSDMDMEDLYTIRYSEKKAKEGRLLGGTLIKKVSR